MQQDKSFRLSLDYEGKHYEGAVTPSEEESKNGMPVYYRVSLGDSLFAYLCCGDTGWTEKDGAQPSSGLIKAIGNYIAGYYA